MAKLTIKGKEHRIDRDELMRLAIFAKPNGHKYTHAEMANELGVTRGAVTKALGKIPKSMLVAQDIENYRRQRADIFADIQKLILSYITPTKLKQTSIQQLGNLFKMFYEKEKLELGLATEHIAVIHQNKLDAATMKKIEEAIEMATTKQILEAKEQSIDLAKGKQMAIPDRPSKPSLPMIPVN